MEPLVSCVMPTANRRAYVPHAIRRFLEQDYPNKELVIIDDGADSVADLVPEDPQIRYLRFMGRRTLGTKRNDCVREARGELILHWDDDDWMAPYRIHYQVEELLRAGAEVCGLARMLFYDSVNRRLLLYRYPGADDEFLAGGSLLYTKDFWRRLPFRPVQVASDTLFILGRHLKRAVFLEDYRFYVALIHSGNTSAKETDGSPWSEWNETSIEELVGDEAAFVAPPPPPCPAPPRYAIIMAVQDARSIAQVSTIRTLQHSHGRDARLVVVDTGCTDGNIEGALDWLKVLDGRNDIQLLRLPKGTSRGAALEHGIRHSDSLFVVTLASDGFPLSDRWLQELESRLENDVKAVGIKHHRDFLHASCLMLARRTVEDLGPSLLNDGTGEQLTQEIRRRGFAISGLSANSSGALPALEPGVEYEGIVRQQWYPVKASAEQPELTIVVAVRAGARDSSRRQNARACLLSLNLQDLERWRYRIVVVEQDAAREMESAVSTLADRYVFDWNPAAYQPERAWRTGASSIATGTLLLTGADLLYPPDFLRRGLSTIRNGDRAVLRYNEILYLDPASTVTAINDRLVAPMHRRMIVDYAGQVREASPDGCVLVDSAWYQKAVASGVWDGEASPATVHRAPERLLHLFRVPGE
jgi:glycosyltransferase involved in cell wall biosynthesis